ncbi:MULTISPECIES: VOC family protein [Mycolicibacterium]|uniref:VOC family protein n=1 Tax=Mycolicibacterium TaxID=1866885 RepID=UPI0007E9D122|nr:hypothetical protein [Mycolicibacterium fortuitum]OBG09401.1 hypothetical protein A5768_15340 [Mycolicibacterium fortuitum]
MSKRDDAYYAGLSDAVEAGDYEAVGPVEFGPAGRAMRLSLIVLYIPEPSLDHAARFYGAILNAEPVKEQHGNGPAHWSITCPTTSLVIEVYPAATRPATATRLEWRGDASAAVQRLTEAHALPEPHGSGGWWVTDPAGNTVVVLGTDAEVATANRRRAAELIGRPLPVSEHERELYEAEGRTPPAD